MSEDDDDKSADGMDYDNPTSLLTNIQSTLEQLTSFQEQVATITH